MADKAEEADMAEGHKGQTHLRHVTMGRNGKDD